MDEPRRAPKQPTSTLAAGATALQDRYAPNSVCFGCGPANPQGLRIKSRVEGDVVVADWKAAKHHNAFEGFVSGGILGVLFDCHSNWAALHFLMKANGLTKPPDTVTSHYSVTFLRPTPIDRLLHLSSKPVDVEADRATVETTLEADGKITATSRGTFVVVKEGHPAYGRWK